MNANSNGLLIAGDPDNNNFAPSRVQNEVVQSELDGVSSLSIRQSTGKIMYLITQSVNYRTGSSYHPGDPVQTNLRQAIVSDDGIALLYKIA
jgi:hypothetical protein